MDEENKTQGEGKPSLDEALEMTRLMNIRMHAPRVKVPRPEGFEPKPVPNDPHSIFIYTNGPFILQLTGDGAIYSIQRGETFDDRIGKVIASVKGFMSQNGMDDPDKNYFPYREIKNDQGIVFKTYINDSIFKAEDGKQKIVRAAIAFFLDEHPLDAGSPEHPVNPDLYQLTLSIGPFDYPTEKLVSGTVDAGDKVTASLLDLFEKILAKLSIGN
jgi:hypothetical protein